MSQFTVKWNSLRNSSGNISDYGMRVNSCGSKISSTINALPFSNNVSVDIRNSLKKQSAKLNEIAQKMSAMGQALEAISDTYKNTEKSLLDKSYPLTAQIKKKKSGYANTGDGSTGAPLDGLSLLKYSYQNEGSILGLSTSSLASVSFGNLEYEYTAGIKNKFKDGKLDEMFVGAKGEFDVSAVKGKVESSIGLLKNTAEVSIGNVAGVAEVGGYLFQDGRFAPSVGVDVSIEGSAIKGNVESQFGTDDLNINNKLEGELLSGKAEAKSKIGFINKTDSSGNVSGQELGASAEAKAEWYLAKGSVSQGINIFGITVDAKLTGKAGGAGVSAGGSLTTGGASGKIGAGLLLGGELELNVDWSKFSFDKLFK